MLVTMMVVAVAVSVAVRMAMCERGRAWGRSRRAIVLVTAVIVIAFV